MGHVARVVEREVRAEFVARTTVSQDKGQWSPTSAYPEADPTKPYPWNPSTFSTPISMARSGDRNGSKPITFIFLSPLLGCTLAIGLTVGLSWMLRRGQPGPIDRIFRRLQLLSAALYSIGHGGNDAQKTMGIIVGLLVANQAAFAGQGGWMSHLHLTNADHVPMWVVLSAHAAIAAGTALGGWRIVKTMGARITRLRPFGGFCAETAGGITLFIASHFGIPVSTTHTITGAIVGVGATQRISAVRWGVAGTIVWAWILTIPMSAAVAGITYLLLH